MRVTLGGQVQRAIRGVQVPRTPMTVSETLNGDGAHHRGELAAVTRDHAGVDDAVSCDHTHAGLTHRPQVEVVLQHLALQLPAPPFELFFELAMAQRRRVGALQPPQQLTDTPPRRLERVGPLPAHRALL